MLKQPGKSRRICERRVVETPSQKKWAYENTIDTLYKTFFPKKSKKSKIGTGAMALQDHTKNTSDHLSLRTVHGLSMLASYPLDALAFANSLAIQQREFLFLDT